MLVCSGSPHAILTGNRAAVAAGVSAVFGGTARQQKVSCSWGGAVVEVSYGRRVGKYLLYGAEILAGVLWQITPYGLPEIGGGKAVILAALAISLAMVEQEIPAMLLGAVCGWMTDSTSQGVVGFYGVLLVIACFGVSVACRYYIRRNRLTVLLLGLVTIPPLFLLHFWVYYILPGYEDGGYMFVRHYLARIVYTLAFLPPCYGLNRLIARRVGTLRR